MGIAVFFVVCCSCPVKRYIRLHLYKQSPLLEKTLAAHVSTNDVKDCTIADRNDQSPAIVFSFYQNAANPHVFVTFYIPAFLGLLSLYFFKRREESYIIIDGTGMPVPIPLYLRMRHLQV